MNEINLKIDKEKCTHCKLCINDCISGILEFNEENFPQIKTNKEKNCLKCQHCLAICPTGALSIFSKDPQNSIVITQNTKAEEIKNLIQGRRSCRQYKQENISEEIMQKLKEIINYTPTGCNYRGLHFSFVEDINTMNKIKNYVIIKLQKILRFVPSKFLKKFSSYKKLIMEGKDVIFRNAPHMLIVSTNKKAPCADIDPIIALSYFELYAQTLGLGTLWCGFAKACFELFPILKAKLNLPRNYKISYVMLFGYPNVKYERIIQPEPFKIERIN